MTPLSYTPSLPNHHAKQKTLTFCHFILCFSRKSAKIKNRIEIKSKTILKNKIKIVTLQALKKQHNSNCLYHDTGTQDQKLQVIQGRSNA